jgi:perosamine synthetase
MSSFIPVNEPLLAGKEKQYLNECIDSGWISSEGHFVQKFEEKFALAVGRKYAVSVCNGSMALEAAIVALGIGSGDEVILPTFTIISCGAAIVKAGTVPVVVDCEAQTWNMDIAQIEAKITPRTKAIMVVHIYGLPVASDSSFRISSKIWFKNY